MSFSGDLRSSLQLVSSLEHSAAYVHPSTSQYGANEPQLLAFAIAKMDGIAGYGGWRRVIPSLMHNYMLTKHYRWIFIIEGIVTVAFGLITKFWISDWPETAHFLTNEERALLIARLSADTGDAVMNRFDKRAATRIFSDPKIYLGTIAYFGKRHVPS
jgi:hypothetical protein